MRRLGKAMRVEPRLRRRPEEPESFPGAVPCPPVDLSEDLRLQHSAWLRQGGLRRLGKAMRAGGAQFLRSRPEEPERVPGRSLPISGHPSIDAPPLPALQLKNGLRRLGKAKDPCGWVEPRRRPEEPERVPGAVPCHQ